MDYITDYETADTYIAENDNQIDLFSDGDTDWEEEDFEFDQLPEIIEVSSDSESIHSIFEIPEEEIGENPRFDRILTRAEQRIAIQLQIQAEEAEAREKREEIMRLQRKIRILEEIGAVNYFVEEIEEGELTSEVDLMTMYARRERRDIEFDITELQQEFDRRLAAKMAGEVQLTMMMRNERVLINLIIVISRLRKLL